MGYANFFVLKVFLGGFYGKACQVMGGGKGRRGVLMVKKINLNS